MAEEVKAAIEKISHSGDLADGEEFLHLPPPLPYKLPPRIVIGPDKYGFKTTTDYRYDDDGNKLKVVTTTRVRKLAGAAVERRSWPKFGDAAADGARFASTVVSDEEIYVLPSTSDAGSATRGDIGPYVPPKRVAAFYDPDHGVNQVSIRVTNLPEEADETDVKDMFKNFGRLKRVSVAVNPKTGRGKGSAIVSFFSKNEAEQAMKNVDGHRYGSLILRVGWANEP